MSYLHRMENGNPAGVLFLCVGNSARSQMAEGFARAYAPAGVEVWPDPAAVDGDAERLAACRAIRDEIHGRAGGLSR